MKICFADWFCFGNVPDWEIAALVEITESFFYSATVNKLRGLLLLPNFFPSAANSPIPQPQSILIF
jgi:hypothetical protein